MTCPFCEDKTIQKRVIMENDLAFAFPTNIPIVPGHTLIIPKRHLTYYEDATLEEKVAIENIREQLKGALKSAFGAEGFNYAWNEEKVGGQSVPHFHLHIIPRKEGDAGIYTYEPREFLYRPGSRDTITPDEELKEVAESIREHL